MSQLIYKYPFPIPYQDEFKLLMPKGAHPVNVGRDAAGVPAIWAIVDTDQAAVERTFHMRGTGHEAPDAKYLGMITEAIFVWHIFASWSDT